ncbi:MAG: flavodoxin-dependent (E)-4-hydroxy-3-methylbut-2-enyl-diphosphate synthase [Endomicrobiales bacterium]
MTIRNRTRRITIGGLTLGGGAPVRVQSMTNTDTRDVAATVRQIRRLEDAGCELVRVAVPDEGSARCLAKIKKKTGIPLAADIHFDHRLALIAIDQGVDKLRLNPGNIGTADKVAAVVIAAKKARVPIRIGVNAGSLKAVHSGRKLTVRERAVLLKDAALEHIRILEAQSFYDTVVSLKASDVATTVEAYRLLAEVRDYPLHLGITEAGSMFRGTIKSAAGLGILLYQGLGDTLRVSLTADPVEEVKVACQLLQSLGLRSTGIEVISCPTCSRCEADLIGIVNELEEKLVPLKRRTAVFSRKPLTVAVMGCVVNGPGEAKEADIGIAGGKKTGMLFENGQVTGQVRPDRWVSTLLRLIRKKSGPLKGS